MINVEKNVRELAKLRYQAERYQIMGNGSMCQRLNAEIRRLKNMISQVEKI